MEDGSRRDIDENYFATFNDDKIDDIIKYFKGSIYDTFFKETDMESADTYRKAFTRFLEKIGGGKDNKKTKELKKFYQLEDGEKNPYTFRCFDERYLDVKRIWFSGRTACNDEDVWVAMYNVFSEIRMITKATEKNWKVLAKPYMIGDILERLMHGLTVERSGKEVIYKPLTKEKREQDKETLRRYWWEYVASLNPDLKADGMMGDLVCKIENLYIDRGRDEGLKKELEEEMLCDYSIWQKKWMDIFAHMKVDKQLDLKAARKRVDGIKEWVIVIPEVVDDIMMAQFLPELPIASAERRERLQKFLGGK